MPSSQSQKVRGLQVLGGYGDAWLIQSHYVPSGYVIVAATGGLDSDMNPVGFREHVNAAYQGLRQIPGRGPYPLVDSFYATVEPQIDVRMSDCGALVWAFDIAARQLSCR